MKYNILKIQPKVGNIFVYIISRFCGILRNLFMVYIVKSIPSITFAMNDRFINFIHVFKGRYDLCPVYTARSRCNCSNPLQRSRCP